MLKLYDFIIWTLYESLDWPTSRCHRTVSIVSLERGVSLFAELQVFFGYSDWKASCQATRAISTSRRELSCFFCKARRRRTFTPFWQKHYGNMHHRMPPSKTGLPSLNVVIFPPLMRLVLDHPKQWQPRRLSIKFMRQSSMTMPRLTGHLQPRRICLTWASNVLITHPILRIWPRRTTTCFLD